MFQVHITGTIEAAAPSGQIFPMGLRKSLGAERKEVETVLPGQWEILMFIHCWIVCVGEFWKPIYEYKWCTVNFKVQLGGGYGIVRVQSDGMFVKGFHQQLLLCWILLSATPLNASSSAFKILATGKCSCALKMLSTERFEGGMHRCSLHPATQRRLKRNPRNVTKSKSLISCRIPILSVVN